MVYIEGEIIMILFLSVILVIILSTIFTILCGIVRAFSFCFRLAFNWVAVAIIWFIAILLMTIFIWG